MAFSPISASSMTTAFMPTSASRRTMQLCRIAPWPMWPLASITVSLSGKPCTQQWSCTFEPSSSTMRPKSPRRLAQGPT
ncbi:Uncharacterised protein [Mycobacterium tuberculosis]|nr:Uncharacterised protein [Mycobacterium tuberculosis]